MQHFYFFIVRVESKKIILFIYFIVYLAIFLDDFLQIHEFLGSALIYNFFELANNMSNKIYLGELIVLGVYVLGLVTIFIFLKTVFKTKDNFHYRTFNSVLILLVFVGVGLDFLGMFFDGNMKIVVGTLEEAGEMILLSTNLALIMGFTELYAKAE